MQKEISNDFKLVKITKIWKNFKQKLEDDKGKFEETKKEYEEEINKKLKQLQRLHEELCIEKVFNI